MGAFFPGTSEHLLVTGWGRVPLLLQDKSDGNGRWDGAVSFTFDGYGYLVENQRLAPGCSSAR